MPGKSEYNMTGYFDLGRIQRLKVSIIAIALICSAVFSGCGASAKKFEQVKRLLDTSSCILLPVDDETSDKEDITDMSVPIMEMLNQTGYCHLTAGIYYIRNGIVMPKGATLEGCGNGTVIRLLDDVENGYCVRVSRFNTVRNIRFSGGDSEPDTSSEEIGDRNGLIFIANRDGKEEPFPEVDTSIVNSCWFENFEGSAIYGHNTGGGLNDGLIVSDCIIHHCVAGINLDYLSEYSKFSNDIIHHCHYACINNGGNNVFVGCTFHGTIGFLIDDSKKDKPNSGHGSAIGCTFNHIDNWNQPETFGGGLAIGIYNNINTFCFDGCQIWYGSVDIKDSQGTSFDACTFGGNNPKITVSDSSTASFSNCVFHQTPELNVGDLTKFSGCYLDETSEEIQAN